MRARASVASLVLALALSAPAAGAQFDLFDWTYAPAGVGSYNDLTPEQMTLLASYDDPVGNFQGYTAIAPVAGTVRARLYYMTKDAVCDASVPVTNVNHILTQLSSCGAFNQLVEFDVQAGTVFGYGLTTLFTTWPGAMNMTEFEFIPDPPAAPWADLGNALAGSLGPPTLTGTGLLHPGYPVHVQLGSALGGSSAALVIGFSDVNQPFAGGVLVPAPDVLVFGLPTGTGELKLSSTWPLHIPAGFTLSMQMWIADPGGAQGWAASNGLGATSQ